MNELHRLCQHNVSRLMARCRLKGRHLVIGIPYVWLVLFFLIPFLIIVKLSVVDTDISNPFGTLVSYADGFVTLKVKISNFLYIANDDLYFLTYVSSSQGKCAFHLDDASNGAILDLIFAANLCLERDISE